MKWDALEEEPCSLARTIGVIGDRWSRRRVMIGSDVLMPH